MRLVLPPSDQNVSREDWVPATEGRKVDGIVIEAPAAIVAPTAGNPEAVMSGPMTPPVTFWKGPLLTERSCQANPVRVKTLEPLL